MMYSILILYMISIISDRIVLGTSDNKMCYIITDKEEEIKGYILDILSHGATIFRAKGGTDKRKENVIMTVVPSKRYQELKDGIEKIDEDAFFIVTDSYELFGGE